MRALAPAGRAGNGRDRAGEADRGGVRPGPLRPRWRSRATPRRCGCSSGYATRRTASRSTSTAAARQGDDRGRCSTSCPGVARCASAPCSSTSARPSGWWTRAARSSRRFRGSRASSPARSIASCTRRADERRTPWRTRRATAARPVDLVVITGYSGAGKSEAIAAFEDGGYFCVDNLPPRMISALGELFRHEGSGVRRAAIVSDVRGGEYFEELDRGARRAGAGGTRPDGALPRGERGDAPRPLQGDSPAPSAGPGRPGGGGDPCRARGARPAARARRRGDGHQRPDRSDAAAPGRDRAARAEAAAASSRSRSSPSASRTARRAKPTSSSTSASCRTRTTARTCAP